MAEARQDRWRATGIRQGGRSAMARASGTLPFKAYVYGGETAEPAAVLAARERYRTHQAELGAAAAAPSGTCDGEVMPDAAPGYEWYAELADNAELAEVTATRDRYQAAMAAAPEPDPPPPVTAGSRCRRCGYLTTAAGHKVMCDE